jgi:hypothetical protein
MHVDINWAVWLAKFGKLILDVQRLADLVRHCSASLRSPHGDPSPLFGRRNPYTMRRRERAACGTSHPGRRAGERIAAWRKGEDCYDFSLTYLLRVATITLHYRFLTWLLVADAPSKTTGLLTAHS